MSNSKSASFNFSSFPSIPGHHAAEWPSRLAFLCSSASNIPTGQDGGLLGFILAPAVYQQRFHHAFQPFQRPDDPGVNGTTGQWRHHDYLKSSFDCESQAISKFMEAIFASLDSFILSLFYDPLTRQANMDAMNFFTVMRNRFAIPDPETITQWTRALQIPMSPTESVRDVISAHRELHSQLDLARGYATPEDVKFRSLLAATQGSIHRQAIITWLTNHPAAGQQLFNDLADYLITLDRVLDSLSSAPVGSMYSGLQVNNASMTSTALVLEANAVALSSKGGSTSRTLQPDIIQAIEVAVGAAMRAQFSKPNRLPADFNRTSRAKHYCWTHGSGTHSGNDCRNPAVGHVTNASASNPQGGNMRGLPSVK